MIYYKYERRKQALFIQIPGVPKNLTQRIYLIFILINCHRINYARKLDLFFFKKKKEVGPSYKFSNDFFLEVVFNL